MLIAQHNPLCLHSLLQLSRCAVLLAILLSFTQGGLTAGMVVVANRSSQAASVRLIAPPVMPLRVTLAPGTLRPFSIAGPVELQLESTPPRSYPLEAGAVYFIAAADAAPQSLELARLTLAAPAAIDATTPLEPTNSTAANSIASVAVPTLLKIPVKILVDDSEPAAQRHWEERLRKRLAAASEILALQCRVRFDVIAVGQWRIPDEAQDFPAVLKDFETRVNPDQARIAIGFCSRALAAAERLDLGGTRGALRSHILLQELPNRLSEAERLEVLVHELGHFLGAVHSPERQSAMRPLLGDRLARDQRLPLGLDPVNALAANLLVEHLRMQPTLSNLNELPAETRRELGSIYATLQAALPDDPASTTYLRLLGGNVLEVAADAPPPQVAATRAVVEAMVVVARRQRNRTEQRAPNAPLKLDEIIRAAARAAVEQPAEHQRIAFLWALAFLGEDPAQPQLTRPLGTETERREWQAALGEPTLDGRRDLAQHFWLSAALTGLVGPQLAASAGLAKELQDAQGTSGFSAADLCADQAGIALAASLLESDKFLDHLAKSFREADFLPKCTDLPDRLSRTQLSQQYGALTDDRFLRLQKLIQQRIRALPGHVVKLE